MYLDLVLNDIGLSHNSATPTYFILLLKSSH